MKTLFKSLSLAFVGLLMTGAAHAAVLSANIVLLDQNAVANFNAAEANHLAGLSIGNVNQAQAGANSAIFNADNTGSAFVLNVGLTDQDGFLTVNLSRANMVSLFSFGDTNTALSSTNFYSSTMANTASFGALNVSATSQTAVLNINAAQANKACLVCAGGTNAAGAFSNFSSISVSNN